jgi:hypothetical protein
LTLADVDRRVEQRDAARFAQQVVEVHVAQVVAVHLVGHARGIGVPVEQVEGEGLLAHQVVVDHEGPDQVVGAQHVEGGAHLRAFQVAAFLHLLFQAGDLAFVDEDAEFARDREVEQGDEEGGRGDALVLLGGHVAHGRTEQRAAKAVADQVEFLFAGLLADHVDGGDRAFGHVVVEALLRQLGIRVHPGNDEHRVALVGRTT